MKLLMILLLVMVGVWLWRSKRQAAPQRKQPPQASAAPVTMVRCAFCAVHLPVNEAVQGQKGRYCSTEHLQRAES